MNSRIRRWSAVLSVGALAAGLTACSSDEDGGSSDPVDPADVESALEEETTLTVWGWGPELAPIAEAFEDEHPNVTVDVVNAGTGSDHYTALQNAIIAGSGAPDVAQMEYYALPQFALTGGLYDLTEVGFDSLQEEYTDASWESVTLDGGIYGLPLGTGPMALFYNQEVFDEHGIEVPATWDEYVEAARQLQEADPDVYITNDAGDAGFATSLIWQAGGQPFRTEDGTTVTIDLQDEGSVRWADTWNELVGEELLAPIASWSDEWYQGLGNGTIASLTIGAWMAGNLESGVPGGAGDWRVAPMPVWDEGSAVTSENGGGGFSVVEQSENKLVAAAFLEFLAGEPGQQITLETVGGVPATVADLTDQEWLDREWEYFGGQQINQIFLEASENVVPGWEYLPFQVYAISIFNDTVGQAYANASDLNVGLQAWQETLVEYGEQQGFTIDAG